MHFNSKLKILSIHYYDSPYSHVDFAGLKSLQKYIDSNVVGNNPVPILATSNILLKRSARKLSAQVKNKDLAIRQEVTYKAVSVFLDFR
jgi:hypothetical protein